jgi:hypothetical protein
MGRIIASFGLALMLIGLYLEVRGHTMAPTTAIIILLLIIIWRQ